MQIAEQAVAYSSQHRKMCVVITLDLRNAFNSALWQMIFEELRRRDIDEGLIGVLAVYLSERAENSLKTKKIYSEVAHGSVLGPTLWNVMYNGLLELELSGGAQLIGFADDVAVVVRATNKTTLMSIANTVSQRVSTWMEERDLQLAPENTEAVLLTTKISMTTISVDVQYVQIGPNEAIKCLGVWLNTKLTFAEHTKRTVQKAEKTITPLLTLMPNIGGPKSAKSRILVSVVHSQILYVASTWHRAVNNKKLQSKLTRIGRSPPRSLELLRMCHP